MQSLDDLTTFDSTSLPWNVSSLWLDNDTYYNSTNYTDLELGGNQFVLPWWRQMIWTLLFTGMIIVATGGNLIVIWIVLAHRRMRTVTNYFLVNLSIADAMVSTLNVTFNYIYMLNSHWPFGTLYCKICQFIAVLTICASVFTLMAISIDRYNVIFMILTYFLPIGSMTFTYARVGLELWGSQSIGEATARQLENIRSKRRVVKMMMVVVVIFAVCWLPFHVYFIVVSYVPEITNKPYIQEVFLGIYWLAMSNSMYNPIIYCWMNTRFRRGFAQVFSWCPWVRVTTEPSLSRSEAVTSRYSCTGSPDMHARISRNGTSTCTLSEEHTCSTVSTTPRSESHLEDANSAEEKNARTSSICLRTLAPILVADDGNSYEESTLQ
ncbi:tachykinin-like peptides receptor 99D isoform X3 [Pseudomyrmex gracilis]|uniref:tachykinin-like peptides receptor 99D isoform X3 n=1 Tax=Pseudomyrmex gracilis TaxID=219809 RepID=UPI000995C608|nr:tachykinin-like peptides receptor 99D isoform X3 [Pseudomyrmex gracilis]